ncbi:hypothetical protein F5X99DRAFT_430152 [Biscogniauxia marginata]|nr:hypothetical protein F5X99DRAFT_430152 [Biscogniauxia marginata]
MSSSSRARHTSVHGPGDEIRPKRSSITIEYSDGGRIVIQRPGSGRGSERRSSRRFSTQSASNSRDSTGPGTRAGAGVNAGARERTPDSTFQERHDSSTSTIMPRRHTHGRTPTPASAPPLASDPTPEQPQAAGLDGIRTSNEAIAAATGTGNAPSRRGNSSTHRNSATGQRPRARVPDIYRYVFDPSYRPRGTAEDGDHVYDTSTSGSTSSEGEMDSTRGRLWMRGGNGSGNSNGNAGEGTGLGGNYRGISGMRRESANGSRRPSASLNQQHRHSMPVPTPSPATTPRPSLTPSHDTRRRPRTHQQPPVPDGTAPATPINIPTPTPPPGNEGTADPRSAPREPHTHIPNPMPGFDPNHNHNYNHNHNPFERARPQPPPPPSPPHHHHPHRRRHHCRARRTPSIHQIHPLLDSLLLLLFRWGPPHPGRSSRPLSRSPLSPSSPAPLIHDYYEHYYGGGEGEGGGGDQRRRRSRRGGEGGGGGGDGRSRGYRYPRQRQHQHQHQRPDYDDDDGADGQRSRESSDRRRRRSRRMSSRAQALRPSDDNGEEAGSRPPAPTPAGRRWSIWPPCFRRRVRERENDHEGGD